MKNSILYLIILLVTISCKNKTEKETIEKKTIKIPAIPFELKDFNMNEIQNIYYYLCVDRWNNNGDIGKRFGTDYSKVAEELNIPVSKLKEIDSYYHYEVEPILRELINKNFENNPNFKTDYYSSLEPTAYCGIHTLMGNVVIFGQKDKTNFKEEATKIAENIIPNLPEWVSGFKLNFTTYKDEILKTEGNVDIGFLWKRGGEIKIMKSSLGLYGYTKPEQNDEWITDEWNNQKKIDYPKINK